MIWFTVILLFAYDTIISEGAFTSTTSSVAVPLHRINCSDLRIGQFRCPPVVFDHETEQPVGCTADNLAPIRCELRAGLICDNTNNNKSTSGSNLQSNTSSSSSSSSSPYSPFSPTLFSSSSPTSPASSHLTSSAAATSSPTEEGSSWNSTQYVDLAVQCQYTNGYSLETALLFSVFLGMFGIDRFYLGYPAIGLLKFCTLGFLFLGQFIDIILIAMQIVRPADGSNYIVKHYGARISIINSFQNDLVAESKARLVIDSYQDIYYYPLDS